MAVCTAPSSQRPLDCLATVRQLHRLAKAELAASVADDVRLRQQGEADAAEAARLWAGNESIDSITGDVMQLTELIADRRRQLAEADEEWARCGVESMQDSRRAYVRDTFQREKLQICGAEKQRLERSRRRSL